MAEITDVSEELLQECVNLNPNYLYKVYNEL